MVQTVCVKKPWRAGFAVAAALFCSAPAWAASLQEHFNNYGAADVPLDGLNGGSGFGGTQWSSSGNAPVFVSLATGSGNGLSYGYDNAGNETDASGAAADGAAGDNGGTLTDAAVRSVGSLAGTLWISALVRYDTPTDDVYLWLDSGDLIGIEDQQAVLDYGSSIDVEGAGADDDDLAGIDPLFAVNETHLLLLKIVFDDPSLNDTYSFWVDPTLDGTEAGLGAPLFTRTGINALGGALTNVGITFSGSGGRLDAIRLSNDADGLLDVANVPEPAPALLVLAGLGWLAARRGTADKRLAPSGSPHSTRRVAPIGRGAGSHVHEKACPRSRPRRFAGRIRHGCHDRRFRRQRDGSLALVRHRRWRRRRPAQDPGHWRGLQAGRARVDRVFTVKNEEAFEMARRLAREEGIFCGISSGANVSAALRYASEPASRVVAIIPSFGERYLNTDLMAPYRYEGSARVE